MKAPSGAWFVVNLFSFQFRVSITSFFCLISWKTF